MQSVVVHHSPSTSAYLQDCIQKKKARVRVSATAPSRSESVLVVFSAILCISLYTQTGKAFCCTSPGSEFFIPLNCLERAGWILSVPGTCVGLYPMVVLNISPNLLMVSCTVEAARSVVSGLENWRRLRAAAKAPKSVV